MTCPNTTRCGKPSAVNTGCWQSESFKYSACFSNFNLDGLISCIYFLLFAARLILSRPFVSCYSKKASFYFLLVVILMLSSEEWTPMLFISVTSCVCVRVFSADRLQSGLSWYCLFKQYYKDLGRYIKYYPVLKRAWEQLKSFLQQRCPRMIASLKGDKHQCVKAADHLYLIVPVSS